MRTNEVMKKVEKIKKELGVTTEEAIEIFVESRPLPKADRIIISRPDMENCPGRHIRKD